MVTADIKLGCGLRGLRRLPRGSVDLLLSDLPSGETCAEFDKPPSLDALWGAVWHALKPNGVAVFMASSLRFASSLLQSQPNAFRYDLIWEKNQPTGFLNAKTRPLRAHEFILVFSRRGTVTYNPQMVETGVRMLRGRRKTLRSENYDTRPIKRGTEGRAVMVTNRYPRSVLRVRCVPNSGKERVHPQQKPDELLRWIVRTYSERGQRVVDPFAGSGSTGLAARRERRRFTGWDKSPRFGGRRRVRSCR
ncbi:MAG TPA: site-specific DNA-methyltransferase [Polyangiaceae bacterium]|nr:site-specific DNA-methyltransferase [Polyangiaceae bacterium]